jgi:hypothetical protein
MIAAPEGRTPPTNSGASSGTNGEGRPPIGQSPPGPRARRTIAADAPAIAGVLEEARRLAFTPALRRVGDRGGKRGAVELAGARRAAHKEAEQRHTGEACDSFDPARFAELTVNHHRWE